MEKKFLRSFFTQRMSILSYQIWLYSPQNHHWTLIDHYGNCSAISPTFLPTDSNINKRYHVDDKQNSITLHYPEGFQFMVFLFDKPSSFDKETIDYLHHLLYPFYTKHLMKSREKEMEMLIEGIQDITIPLDLEQLLTKFLDNLSTLIPGTDTAVLWMYNPAIDRLVCKAFRGWNEEIKKVQYKVGESVAGKTFRDGKQRIYHSFREAMIAMKGTSKENSQHLQNAFHNRWVKSSVTVPISAHNETIGVLSLHQCDRERKITEWHIKLLQGLSAQIAIAIENARLFSEIQRKNKVLIKRNEIHDRLKELTLQNKGLDIITRHLSQMLDLPLLFVNFLDNQSYPQTIDKHVFFSINELTMLFSKRKTPIYVDLIETEKRSFYIYPIIIGSVLSGCIIVTVQRLLTQLDQISLEQGGAVLALELVKKQSLSEVYYKKIHNFFNDLIRNENTNMLYNIGLDYGIDLRENLVCIVFEISSYYDLQVLEATTHRLVLRIKQKLPDVNKIVFGYHNKVTLLLSFTDSSRLQTLIKKIEDILKDWELGEGLQLGAGMGTFSKGIDAVSRSYTEANKALAYHRTKQQRGLIQFSEIGINRLFLNQSTEDVESFLQEIFSPLTSKKARNNDLEQTIITYIQTNRSATQTAEKLHIHINTFYQRIKKIESLLGLSFDKPEDILKIQLACHLRASFFRST